MISNGRIDLLHAPNHLALFDKIPVATSSYNDAMTGNWANTPLSLSFFSVQNQQILQNGIRAGVYHYSKGKYTIAEQSNNDLKMIMRAIFLEHSENRLTHVIEQIHELNQYVLDYCVPRVLGEAQGYLKYLQDASTLAVPLSAPIYSSIDKTLELKTFF